MKKFILFTIGFTQPTPELMQPWMAWFASIKDKMIDQVGLTNGKIVTTDGSISDIPMDLDAMTGYVLIQAQDNAEAEKIAQSCPAVTSTLVYEVRSHAPQKVD